VNGWTVAALTARTWRTAILAAAVVVSATPASAQETRADEAAAERDAKAKTVAKERRPLLERILYAIEDDLLIERWLAAPRGVFVRLGAIGEGAGFGLGPAFRYNAERVDIRASAAGSVKQYVIGELSVRVPGTQGYNEYIRPEGPYVELQTRFRDMPQEDFFGLGADSVAAARSNYALSEVQATGTGGYLWRNAGVGLTAGHVEYDTRPGTDTRMPSSTDTFSAAGVPGLLAGRPRFVTVGPFVRVQTRDRSENRPDGGEYSASFTRFLDQSDGRFSFDRWDVDLRQYLSFGRRTRGIALRAWSASTSPHDGHEVPFYLQPWVGGARSVRGFRTFRFRDRSALLLQGEYRWRINELMSGALFADAGAVAPRLQDLGRLEKSYGAGLRVGGRMGSALRVDMAFGSGEGTRLLVRFDDVF
jgi:hypothetical protein